MCDSFGITRLASDQSDPEVNPGGLCTACQRNIRGEKSSLTIKNSLHVKRSCEDCGEEIPDKNISEVCDLCRKEKRA